MLNDPYSAMPVTPPTTLTHSHSDFRMLRPEYGRADRSDPSEEEEVEDTNQLLRLLFQAQKEEEYRTLKMIEDNFTKKNYLPSEEYPFLRKMIEVYQDKTLTDFQRYAKIYETDYESVTERYANPVEPADYFPITTNTGVVHKLLATMGITAAVSCLLYWFVPDGTCRYFGGVPNESTRFWIPLVVAGDALIAYLCRRAIYTRKCRKKKRIFGAIGFYNLLHCGAFLYGHYNTNNKMPNQVLWNIYGGLIIGSVINFIGWNAKFQDDCGIWMGTPLICGSKQNFGHAWDVHQIYKNYPKVAEILGVENEKSK